MSNPLVSVIIPVYNAGRHIAETIESALRQTYRHREILVVDDGSSDDSPQVVDRYRSSVTYVRQENAGPGAARNRGLSRASGDYIALLDHDDLWLPRKLEVQLSVATRRPESGLIACDGVQFDDDVVMNTSLLGGPAAARLMTASSGEVTERFYREFVQGCPIACPAQTLIPHQVVDRIGPMMTNREEASDWDYYLRIASHYPVTLHRDSLVRWRYLPTSRSGPQARRDFVWALSSARMLKRHRRLCTVEDRPLVISKLRQVVIDAAKAAYLYGREHDMAFARSYLSTLCRLVPGETPVMLFLAASWLPEPVVQRLVRLGRLVGLVRPIHRQVP